MGDSEGRLVDRAKGQLVALRRRPAVDHAVRAYGRFDEARGNQHAAAVTFFGFLSFFPLLALAFAVLGYVVEWVPDARDQVTTVIENAFPGLVGTGPGQINVDRIAGAREGAGLVGLAGLLWSGTAWVDALREALRAVFGTGRPTGSLPVRKLWDIAILAALGVASLASVSFSGVVTSLAGDLLGLVDLDGSVVAQVALRTLTLGLVLAADVGLFAILFVRLPGHRPPWPQMWSGALLGAVGFELLKLLATLLVGRTTSNPVYAGVAVAVGLLVWTNLVSRLVLFAASWTATQPTPKTVRSGVESGFPAGSPEAPGRPGRAAHPPRRGRGAHLVTHGIVGVALAATAAWWWRSRE